MKNTIEKLVKKDYDTIQDEETVKDAIAKFSKKSHPRTLLVFNNKNEYIGILTQRNIFRSGYQTDNIKIKKLYVKAPKINKNMTIFEVAKLMLDSNMKHLPVFEGRTILGRVRTIDVLKAALEITNIGDIPVRRFMTSSPLVVERKDKISTVMHLFQDSAISRVPVMDDGVPVGIVSMHDLIVKVRMPNKTLNFGDFQGEKSPELNAGVDNIMNYPVKSLPPSSPTRDAITMMDELDLNSIMLVDAEDRLNGIITKKDLLEPLATINKGKHDERRFIQLRGDTSELDDYDKASMIKVFEDLLEKYNTHMKESHAFVYITPHKGKFGKGKTRGVNMYYIRARISSDLGTFIASTEEFGCVQTANETARLLDKQMNTHLEKIRNKDKMKSGIDSFEVKATI